MIWATYVICYYNIITPTLKPVYRKVIEKEDTDEAIADVPTRFL